MRSSQHFEALSQEVYWILEAAPQPNLLWKAYFFESEGTTFRKAVCSVTKGGCPGCAEHGRRSTAFRKAGCVVTEGCRLTDMRHSCPEAR